MEHYDGIPLEEVQRYSRLSRAGLRFYVKMGLLPRPHVEREGRGTQVWYPQEVFGLLTAIQRLRRQGMKLKDITELIGQQEVIEGETAKELASASAPSSSQEKEMATIASLGNQLRKRLPDREVVMAVYDTEERDGEQIMVPVKIVHLPKS